MVDTHCHLTYEPLHAQLEDVLARAEAAGVRHMVTIGTDVADARRAVELCRGRDNIRCAVGIHPHRAGQVSNEAVEQIGVLEREATVVALGEMGLDYHYDFAPRDKQREIFEAQLALARERKRPIVIHCREAVDDCLAILSAFSEIPADFHCFTGTADEARRILDRGYLIGFTGVVTFKRSEELRDVARFVPPDQFVVETDAAYLSPEPFRKHKVNEPALVMHTAAAVARERRLGVEELDRLTTANAAKFFRWPYTL